MAKRRPNQLKRLQALVRKHRDLLRTLTEPETHLFRKPCRPLLPEEVGKGKSCLDWIHRETRGKSDWIKLTRTRFALSMAGLLRMAWDKDPGF